MHTEAMNEPSLDIQALWNVCLRSELSGLDVQVAPRSVEVYNCLPEATKVPPSADTITLVRSLTLPLIFQVMGDWDQVSPKSKLFQSLGYPNPTSVAKMMLLSADIAVPRRSRTLDKNAPFNDFGPNFC